MRPMWYFDVKLSLKHRFVPSFSVLFQRIDEDIAFSSLETCTEIGSHQTINVNLIKVKLTVNFYITQSYTQEALFGFSLATKYGLDWPALATKIRKC